jgi:mannosyltransferase
MKSFVDRSPGLMNPPMKTLMVGGPVILLALVTPLSGLLHFLGARPGDHLDEFVLGITLFKYSLVAFGFFLIALGRLPIWQPVTRGEKAPADSRHNSLNLALITAILCLAAVLRLYALDSGLWLDEILTYVNYARLPFGEIITTYDDQNQHFLYTLLAHASMVIFGDSTWSLRLPAALFGVGSIWALYLFGRQVSTERESLLACALVSFSYHHVWFSQNARGYIGLLFWTLLASWLLLRGLREAQPRLWLLYGAAAALGVYTNTAMLFVIMGHFIIYLCQLWTRRGSWPCRWAGLFLGFCFAGLLTLLLHALVLPQMLAAGVEESTVPAWKHPLWAVLEFMGAIKIGFAGMIAAVGALLVFGIGLWSFARTEPAVVQLMIVPALACAAVVIGMGYHVWPRLFFFTFGFAALIVVRGTMLLGQYASRLLKTSPTNARRIGTAFAAGLILVSAVSLPRAYYPKQDFLAALNFIEAQKEPGDTVAMVGLVVFVYKNLYARDWQEVGTLEELDSIRSRSKHTWLLYTFPTHVTAVYPEIMRAIQKDFQTVKQFPGTIGDGSIFVSRSNGRPS